jgi:integral membrane sensor domain MASE1
MTWLLIYLGGVVLVLAIGLMCATQGAMHEWGTSARFPRWARYAVFFLAVAATWPLFIVIGVLGGIAAESPW